MITKSPLPISSFCPSSSLMLSISFPLTPLSNPTSILRGSNYSCSKLIYGKSGSSTIRAIVSFCTSNYPLEPSSPLFISPSPDSISFFAVTSPSKTCPGDLVVSAYSWITLSTWVPPVLLIPYPACSQGPNCPPFRQFKPKSSLHCVETFIMPHTPTVEAEGRQLFILKVDLYFTLFKSNLCSPHQRFSEVHLN